MKHLLFFWFVLLTLSGCGNRDRTIYLRINDKTEKGYAAEYSPRQEFSIKIFGTYRGEGESDNYKSDTIEFTWKYENMKELKAFTAKKDYEYRSIISATEIAETSLRFVYRPPYVDFMKFLESGKDTLTITPTETINDSYNWPYYQLQKQQNNE